jgi:S1-C subfamily serine protease
MSKRDRFQSNGAAKASLQQPGLGRMAVVLLAGLLLLMSSRWSTAQQQPLWTSSSRAARGSSILVQFNRELQQHAAAVLPAVVSLKVHTKRDTDAPPENHPNVPDTPSQIATGSGYIIRADGLVVTKDHEEEDVIRIDVKLYGGDLLEDIVI